MVNEYRDKGPVEMSEQIIASSACKPGGGTTQSSQMKQHSKTQRIHVNRIQYNQKFGALSGVRGASSGFNSSLSKQGDVSV